MSPHYELLPDQDDASGSQHKRPTIDISTLDSGLKRWIAYVSAGKKKTRPQVDEDCIVPIHSSVFQPKVEPPLKPIVQRTLDHEPLLTADQIAEAIESVRDAIANAHHPRLNNAGSSGSYFCKNTAGDTLGIFKPKSEEPYGSLNPKWTKFFHRNLLGPFIGFGRSCLIPNLSYLSESAASLLDTRLNLHMVPATTVDSLSSKAFYYSYVDRRAAHDPLRRSYRPLPEKQGSFQLFAKGYVDANVWLAKHPWPGSMADEEIERPRHRKRGFKWSAASSSYCSGA